MNQSLISEVNAIFSSTEDGWRILQKSEHLLHPSDQPFSTHQKDVTPPAWPNSSVVAELSLSISNISLNNFTGASNITQCRYSEPQKSLEYPHSILLFSLPFIILAGTVGNVLSIIVLRRRVMQMTATFIYLTVMAIPDLTVLYFSALKTWIRLVSGFELLHVSNAACKITKYIFFTSTHISAWLVVAVTIERLLVVRLPFKAPKMCCHRQARIITLALVFVIMVLNLNIVFASELVVVDSCGTKRCTAYQDSNYINNVFPKINLFVYSLLPFTLVLVMNLAIIKSIMKNSKLFKQLQLQRQHELHMCASPSPNCSNNSQQVSNNSQGGQQVQLIRQRRITFTLLTISFLWLLLTGPYTLMDTLAVTSMHPIPMVARMISYLLMYMNHAINFYIYLLTGRKFRYELRRVFCRKWKPPIYQKVPFKQPSLVPVQDKQRKETSAPDLGLALPTLDMKQLKSTTV